MGSRKKVELQRPDVTADVQSEEALRRAFAREMPVVPPFDPDALELSSPEEYEAKKAFTLFVWACVDALFDAMPAPLRRLFSSWSPLQQALITEIAKLPTTVLVNVDDLSDRLRSIGMFDVVHGDGRYLDRYAGLVAPSVLERIEEERPLWFWIRLRLQGEVSPEELLRVTAPLDAAQRIELVRLAVDNCYQLLRRWPFPRDITPEQEGEDTQKLFDAVSPILALVDDATLERTLADEIAREHPADPVVLLIALALSHRGRGPIDAEHAALADAASLYAVHGRRLLEGCSPQTRSAVLALMEPVPHNVRGFWALCDLLDPQQRAERITRALSEFKRPCKSQVAARVQELVAGLPAGARAALEVIASGTGPNAAVVRAALTQVN